MKKMTRPQIIEELRAYLLQFVDEEHSVCQVAAERKIFCKGFRQFSEGELREKFDWISCSRSHLPRKELESVINKYKLARNEAVEVPMNCDAQMIDRDTCLGWDEFSDEELAQHYHEFYGEEARVTS